MADTYVVLKVGMKQLLIAEPRAFSKMKRRSTRLLQVRSLLTRVLHDKHELEKLRQFMRQHPGSHGFVPHHVHAPDEGLVTALDNALAHGQLVALLMDYVPAARTVAGQPQSRPQLKSIGSLGERLKKVVLRAIELAPAAIADDLEELTSGDNIYALMLFGEAMATAHAVGMGVEADALALGIAFAFGGYKAVQGLFQFGMCIGTVLIASSDNDIEAAARLLVEAAENISVAAIIAVLHRISNPGGGGGEGAADAQVNAYETPIERDPVKPQAQGSTAPPKGAPLSSRIAPNGGLAANESAGGHLLLKHVGQSESQLMERLAAEPKITSSSSFYDRAGAENAVSEAVDKNAAKISDWLSGSSGRLKIEHTGESPVGISVARGANGAVDVSSTRLILVRDPSMPAGYRILTGFPIKP